MTWRWNTFYSPFSRIIKIQKWQKRLREKIFGPIINGVKSKKRFFSNWFFKFFENFINSEIFFSEWQMRMASTVHHTNPRSATLDFWRKTTSVEDYKIIQAKRRAQMNKPTRSLNNTVWFEQHTTFMHNLLFSNFI